MNHILLSSITRTVTYPIPQCDDAVGTLFSGSKFRWLMDATSGYHPIRVAPHSQPKLTLAGPRGTKFTYNVMPFGPVNGPVVLIIFIHDMDQTQKEVFTSRGISIDTSSAGLLLLNLPLSISSASFKFVRVKISYFC